jgi:hypothetical protein
MSGLSDYSAENYLEDMCGVVPPPSSNMSRWLALFTAAPTSDAGTGGTEVSGGSYARVQVAGALTLNGSFTTSSTTLTLASTAPAWLLAIGQIVGGSIASPGAGMNVYDITNAQQIGTVSSVSGTTVTLTGTAAHASSGAADSILFSAFGAASASSGSEPATSPANITNAAIINFPTATGNWGTVPAFGVYDAVTSGNLRGWDYMGASKWIPFACSSASPGVLTCDATADAPANGSSIVVTQKYGGTLPTTGGSWAGLLTTANLSGATFTAGVNTTGIGGGQFRQVTQVGPIGNTVTASFAASQLTVTAA